MKKVFVIDGGIGRVITAVPALEKYILDNPDHNVIIVVYGWGGILMGNKLLQDKVFDAEMKGLFDLHFKDADEVVAPEPYRMPAYYNQKISLTQAFDIVINGRDNSLKPSKLYTSKRERMDARNIYTNVKKHRGNRKTIVVQPFGSTAYSANPVQDGGCCGTQNAQQPVTDILDDSSRSFETSFYLKLVSKLTKKVNVINYSDPKFFLEEDTYTTKIGMDLRQWMSVIEAADYFVGCDSSGQHIARSFNVPGTIIMGSTFPINVSYPDWFQIIEKPDQKKYSPIRICNVDCSVADRYNDNCMSFDDQEIDDIVTKIFNDMDIAV